MQNILPYLEQPATLARLINVYLVARVNIWNYLFGVIAVTLFAIIFFHSKLYADISLQMVYLILQFYGSYQWRYSGAQHAPLQIKTANQRIYSIYALAMLGLFVGYVFILKYYTDSTTIYIDAFTTALSPIAQWMMSKKFYENWWLWIAVDIISIKMYLIKHLYLTSGLYFIFLIICRVDYYHWKKQLHQKIVT